MCYPFSICDTPGISLDPVTPTCWRENLGRLCKRRISDVWFANCVSAWKLSIMFALKVLAATGTYIRDRIPYDTHIYIPTDTINGLILRKKCCMKMCKTKTINMFQAQVLPVSCAHVRTYTYVCIIIFSATVFVGTAVVDYCMPGILLRWWRGRSPSVVYLDSWQSSLKWLVTWLGWVRLVEFYLLVRFLFVFIFGWMVRCLDFLLGISCSGFLLGCLACLLPRLRVFVLVELTARHLFLQTSD